MTGSAGKVVDLFCGCGGFSLGAEMAGFSSIVAIDVDPVLQSGYKRNFPGSLAVQASLADIDLGDWRQLIGGAKPDLVIGGPPCQGFSRIGRKRADDPRNSLVSHFYRHVAILRPKMFVMENVEGLLDGDGPDILQAAIEQLRGTYTVLDPILVDAAKFGAATSRRRLVVVGYDPNEVDPISPSAFAPPALLRPATVRDAISDLPPPSDGRQNSAEFEWSHYPDEDGRLSAYAARLRRPPTRGLGWPEAVRRLAAGDVSGLASTRHAPSIAARYGSVEPGKVDGITKSSRLAWEGRSPTIRAGTGADKGSFQAVRPIHPEEGRVITVREAARLQGFPDWFVFHPTKWHSFRMIGNSVSPFVSEGVLRPLAAKLQLSLAA